MRIVHDTAIGRWPAARLVQSFAALAAAGLLLTAETCPSTPSEADTGGITLDKTKVNEKPDPAQLVNGRHYLVGSTTLQWNLPGVVGHALYVSKENGVCPATEKTSYSMIGLDADSYVKDPAKLTLLDKLGAPIYDSRVDKGADLDLNILIFSGGAHAEDFAEVALTNVNAMPNTGGLVDDYANKIRAKLTDNDCYALIVTGATVQFLSTRWFKHISGSGVISGPTFGVNGKVYNNQDKSENQALIAIDYSLVRKPGREPLENPPVPAFMTVRPR